MKRNNTLIRLKSELRSALEEIKNIIIVRIKQDLDNLNKIKETDSIYQSLVNSLGKGLHDFYDAIQTLIFERIVEETQEGKPQAVDYHTLLLRNMSIDIEGLRIAVISKETYNKLLDYLRFRHLFRHTYSFRLELKKFSYLAEEVEVVFELLKKDINNFLKKI